MFGINLSNGLVDSMRTIKNETMDKQLFVDKNLESFIVTHYCSVHHRSPDFRLLM